MSRIATRAAQVALIALGALLGPVGIASAGPSNLGGDTLPFDDPYGVAISPDATTVAIMGGDSGGSISFVSPSSLTIDATVSTSRGQTYNGVFDATGSTLFATDLAGDAVEVIENGTLSTPIAVGDAPDRIVRVPSNRIVTQNKGGSGAPGVSVIDAPSRALLRTVNTGTPGDQLTSIASSETSSTVWVTSVLGQYLKAVHIETGTVTDITPTLPGTDTELFAYASSDGSTLALITAPGNRLYLIDATSGGLRQQIDLGDLTPRAVVFSPDGATANLLGQDTTSSPNRIYIRSYTVATGALSREIALSDDESFRGIQSPHESFSILPDGSRVIFATENTADSSTRVYFADVRDGSLSHVELPGFNTFFGSLSLTTRGDRLYATNYRTPGLVAAVETASVPSAPREISASAGDSSATIGWTAPTDDGGAAVTRYTATATPGGASCTWTSGDLGCSISGLTNGTTYSVAVTATTLAGTSAASTSASVMPGEAPGAPTGVTATAGLLKATVSWTAPSSDGGSPITAYTATASPGGKTCTATTTSCTITGLDNTKAYTFTVTATNAVGTSSASTATKTTRPYKALAMKKPRTQGTRIVSTVTTTSAATITQTIRTTTNKKACTKRIRATKKKTYTVTCPLNKTTRNALKKQRQTLTVTTTVLTRKGATLQVTHTVRVNKTR